MMRRLGKRKAGNTFHISCGKRGQNWMTEETLKTILSIVVIVLLVFLVWKIISIFMTNTEYEQAKAVMKDLEGITSYMSVGETKYLLVESPKDWMFVVPYSNQPNKLCYCKSEINWWNEHFSREVTINSKVQASCDAKGVCFDVKSLVSVPSSCYVAVGNCARLDKVPMMMRVEKSSEDKTSFALQGYYSDRDALLNDLGKVCYYLGFSSMFSETGAREAFDLPTDVEEIIAIELEGNVDESCAKKLAEGKDCMVGDSLVGVANFAGDLANNFAPATLTFVDDSGKIIGLLEKTKSGYVGVIQGGTKLSYLEGLTINVRGEIVASDGKVLGYISKNARVLVSLLTKGAPIVKKVYSWGDEIVALGTKAGSKTIRAFAFVSSSIAPGSGKLFTAVSKFSVKVGGKALQVASVGSMVCDVYTLSKTIGFAFEDTANAVSSGKVADEQVKNAVVSATGFIFNDITVLKDNALASYPLEENNISIAYGNLVEKKKKLHNLYLTYLNNGDVKRGSLLTFGREVSKFTDEEDIEISNALKDYREEYIKFSNLISVEEPVAP